MVASPDESGCIVTHENVPAFSNGNYEKRSLRIKMPNAQLCLKEATIIYQFTKIYFTNSLANKGAASWFVHL